MPGLLDRSRPSHSHPNATAEDMVTLVIGARRSHPTWWLPQFEHGKVLGSGGVVGRSSARVA
jgi:hypothetical protein